MNGGKEGMRNTEKGERRKGGKRERETVFERKEEERARGMEQEDKSSQIQNPQKLKILNIDITKDIQQHNNQLQGDTYKDI